jgi:hypothetical protein
MAGSPATLLEDTVEGWDYAMDLRLERTLDIDLNAAAETLRIAPEDLLLTLVVTVGTGGARGERMRRVVWRSTPANDGSPMAIAFDLPGPWLSRSVTLTTELILGQDCAGSRLSPRMATSRLWRDVKTVNIEPAATRFPMEATSFRTMFPDSSVSAPWHLEWSTADLDREFAAAVRLYLNKDIPEFVSRFTGGDPTDVRLVMGAVITQLCRGVVDIDAFDLSMAQEQGETLGGVTAAWLQRAFPNQALTTIRAIAQSRPAVFESVLATLASLGDDSE